MAKANPQPAAAAAGAAVKAAAPAQAEQTPAELMGGLMQTPLGEEIQKVVDTVYPKEPGLGRETFGALLGILKEYGEQITAEGVTGVDDMIAWLDVKLTNQVNEILHHPDFRKLEGTWRALERLVFRSDLNNEHKIRVMNVSKDELLPMFEYYKGGRWDESPLFTKLYTQEFGTLNGKPYGCIVGDFEFSHASDDLKVLRGMAKIAQAAHAPFVAAAAPQLLKMDSWAEVNLPPDVTAIFQRDEFAPWRAFRRSEESKYVGLTLPRVLAREPYKAGKGDFSFEEDTSAGADAFCWSNSAFALAENINRSFTLYGWATQFAGVESGGMVEDLPCHTYTMADGREDMTCPTEVAIPFAREYQLSSIGLIPLCHAKQENWAAFIGSQSASEAKEYDNPEATKNSRLTADLSYTFALSRFAHFLKKMVYLKINTPMSRADIETWLQGWINQYVLLNPDGQSMAVLAEKPLSAAKVSIVESDDDPGVYRAVFHLQPHFRLKRIDVSLRLVSSVPKPK